MGGKIGIAVDSTADFPEGYVKKTGIHLIPIQIAIDEQKFRHGIDITNAAIVKALRNQKNVTTEPVIPGDYTAVFEKLLTRYDTVISFHASTHLSKCFTSAQNALNILSNEDAERVFPIDTGNVSIGQGLIVIKALELLRINTPVHKIEMMLKKYIEQSSLLFTVENLYWLKRAKRLNMLSAFLGGMLDLKPVIGLENGSLVAKSKHMGTEKALKEIRSLVETKVRSGQQDFHIWIAHSHALDKAFIIQEALAENLDKNPKDIRIIDIGPTLTVHTGPGCICIGVCPRD